MIQIHIPSTQHLVDRTDSQKSFTVYDFHINGHYHASVRYNHLCMLHAKLIENFGFRLTGPEFPPKRIWRNLDAKAVNERREGLVKYFQSLIQNNDVAKHFILERAFLEYQVNSFNPSMQATSIEVYLPDGHCVKVEVYADDSTAVVMKKFCKVIKMDEKFAEFFGLFLAKEREDRSNAISSTVLFDYVCVRWLKNFESPFISQKLANKNVQDEAKHQKILVRRVIWDPTVEEPLLDDPGALKLLFLQALNDVQHNFVDMDSDTKQELARLAEQNDFYGFIKVCHRLPSYGFEVLESVISDYPVEETKCCFKVGRRMIVLQYVHEGRLTQALLKSTRIRTWKISHTDGTKKPQTSFQIELTQALLKSTRIRTWKISHTDGTKKPQTSFQIEYVLGTGVDIMTFYTNQAVLISLFLQSIADEILRDCRAESPTYKFDDTIQTRVISNLKASQENSIVGEDSSIKENNSSASSLADSNSNYTKVNPLLQIISYQMPFENENFDFVTDSDL
uniref:PX domain-containing protein n=1 Tax=Panagrolaimus sp. JU765 TaxID=591449 RepID=A0AC34QQB8_9BILA